MAKKWTTWAAGAAVALVLAAGAGKAFQARQAKQAQAAEAAEALRKPTVFELTTSDVVQARTRTLVQTVPISGVLRAANTAAVKAKVAGELSGLQVREGDAVQAGQVLGRIDTTEYQARTQQAAQQAQAAAAQVAIAQRQLANNQALVAQGFISSTALETSLSNLAAAQANHRAAQAAQDIAAKSLADTVLRSPISGQVASRLAQNGERVGVDARVLELVDLSSLELEAAVPPELAAQLLVGQTARLTVEGGTTTVQAKLVRISPSAQAASRSVLVYLKLSPAPGLRHGLFAQGLVLVGERTGTAVPASSVRNDRPQPYVQLVQASASASEPAHIAHVPVKVLGQGLDALSLDKQAVGAAPESALFILTDSIAEGAFVTSVKTGFIQQNTSIRLMQATTATPTPATSPR